MFVLTFTARNLKLFFRDKAAVFFSLLAVFIIIALYALFLSDMQVNQLKVFAGEKTARFLVDSWIMAGILAVNSVTITLGAFGVIINDEERKIIN
ncbi:MAG TPA: ABC transporter permease, partial [Clostridia bacterium]|nr:ABC transporter permease [Clostridia bacterium]